MNNVNLVLDEHRKKCELVLSIDDWDCYEDCQFFNGEQCTYYDNYDG